VVALEGPDVECVGEEDGLRVQLPGDGGQEGHSVLVLMLVLLLRVGMGMTMGIGVMTTNGGGIAGFPWVLLLVEDAAVEAAFDDGLGGALAAASGTGFVLPFFVAHVDLADGEDELVDAIAQLGGEAQERGDRAIAIVAGWVSSCGEMRGRGRVDWIGGELGEED